METSWFDQPAQLARALLEAIGNGAAQTLESLQTYLKCTREGSRFSDISSPTTSSVCEFIPSSQLRLPTAPHHSSAPFLECCTRRALDYLIGLELIVRTQTADAHCGGSAPEGYSATQLGSAVLNSAIEIGVGLSVYRDLSRARRCLSLESDLHLVYLVQ